MYNLELKCVEDISKIVNRIKKEINVLHSILMSLHKQKIPFLLNSSLTIVQQFRCFIQALLTIRQTDYMKKP